MARSNMRWRAWRLKLIASQSMSALVEIVAALLPELATQSMPAMDAGIMSRDGLILFHTL